MSLREDLKTLLANTTELYLRAHGYHWNVEGEDFRMWHGTFEEIYSDLYDSIDLIAENIRKVGEYAPYRLARMNELCDLPEKSVTTSPHDMAEDLLNALGAYVDRLNACFAAATEANEQGIANFLSERIDTCQKWCWFLRASLKV